MVKQDIESQYDDDLTVGTDEYDDSYYTDADDLFEFSTNDESPISRLKSLVLSIDWEITNEVLQQFNEELIDLKSIWAGNSINLVYVQALDKLGKYIYQNKADSHPTAIKLLLTLYYNLEKIVSSKDLSEEQKKEILLEDVRKFEGLKRQIGKQQDPPQEPKTAPPETPKLQKQEAEEDILLNLKAIVLGIDWEITDQDLNDLRKEVIHLEEKFSDSRPKLILLQGIGTLGAYIKMKKSNAHSDAFKVLHLFYESLEEIVQTPMSLEDEKGILFPAVEKFNAFKAILGPTITPEAISRKDDDEDDEDEDEDYIESASGEIAPAFADIPEEESIGFQADVEAKTLGLEGTGVSSHIEDFFGETFEPAEVHDEKPAAQDVVAESLDEQEIMSALGFDDEPEVPSFKVDRDIALAGVDVEADDEDEGTGKVEPHIKLAVNAHPVAEGPGVISSALADADVLLEFEDEQQTVPFSSEEDIAKAADAIFPDDETPLPEAQIIQSGIDRDIALQGVNVETEADEDSDEISLPMMGEELAPALVASEEESIFSAETLETSVAAGGISEEIVGTLDDLFLANEPSPSFAETVAEVEENDFVGDASPEESIEVESDELVPFQIESSDELTFSEAIEEGGEASAELAKDDWEPLLTEPKIEKEDSFAVPEQEDEDDLSMFFTGSDLEEGGETATAVDSLFESLEPAIVEEDEAESSSSEVDEQLDAFFGLDETLEEPAMEMPTTSFADEEVVTELEAELETVAEEAITEVDTGIEQPEEMVVEAEEELESAEELMIEAEPEPAEEEVALEAEVELEPAEERVFDEEPVPAEEEVATEPEIEFEQEEESIITAGEVETEIQPALRDEIVEEDDVVFELAEEYAEDESLAVEEVSDSLAVVEPEEAVADEVEESIALELPEAEIDGSDLAFVATEFLGDTDELPRDLLGDLRACVESLNLELDDKILAGLYQEINALRQEWSDKPLEKTFLQLLSTITQHIDQYRFEASSDAYSLLLSVCQALSNRRDDDTHHTQQLLLTETLKVLEWQQGMLARQAVKKGDHLTFTAPVRTEDADASDQADAQEDFDQLLQHYEENDETGSSSLDDSDQQSQPEPEISLADETEAGNRNITIDIAKGNR